MLRDALAEYERSVGPEHPQALGCARNLAVLLKQAAESRGHHGGGALQDTAAASAWRARARCRALSHGSGGKRQVGSRCDHSHGLTQPEILLTAINIIIIIITNMIYTLLLFLLLFLLLLLVLPLIMLFPLLWWQFMQRARRRGNPLSLRRGGAPPAASDAAFLQGRNPKAKYTCRFAASLRAPF